MFKRRSPEGERHGWGHHGGHHGWGHHGGHHKGPWAVFGPIAKRAFKLSKYFGGDPEIYREFVEKNPDKGFHELREIYVQEHNIKDRELTEERITKKCQKLAFIFKEPAQNFVELVKSNPAMKAWQLVELKRNGGVQSTVPVCRFAMKFETKPEEVKTEVSKKVEEPVKPEEKVIVREIGDDDLTASNISLPKVESVVFTEEKKVSEIKPIVEEPKSGLKFKNQFEHKESDFKMKNAIISEMVNVLGPQNDYTGFVRSNYKQGTEQCLNLWFESHN